MLFVRFAGVFVTRFSSSMQTTRLPLSAFNFGGTFIYAEPLIQPLGSKEVAEVCSRAKLVADRAKIADQVFPDVDLVGIVRREIDEGATVGGF